MNQPRLAGRVVALLGPPGAGKSSLGRHLARGPGWQAHSLDAHCWDYYAELPEVGSALAVEGGIRARARALAELRDRVQGQGGEEGRLRWRRLWQDMRLHAVERGVVEARSLARARSLDVALELGSGHARIDGDGDNDSAARLNDALAACDTAVWLQPHTDPDEAARLLELRLRDQGRSDAFDRAELARACAAERRPRQAALLVTGSRALPAVADQLLAWLDRRPA